MRSVRPFPVQSWFTPNVLNPIEWIIAMFEAHWLFLGPGVNVCYKKLCFTHLKAKTARTGGPLPDFTSVANSWGKFCI